MSACQSEHVPVNELAVMRDVQVAQEIRSMAALGVFPKGIVVYGLVYYQNGQRQYMISSDPANLISFLNDVENRKLFPTPMESYSERLIIPEGYEADIINKIKLKLAKKLQNMYPAPVFAMLEQLHNKVPNDSMAESLIQYRRELESVFQADKIQAFQGFCTRAYLRKNISELVYQQLIGWCKKRLAQLEVYVAPAGSKEKKFYGLAVLQNHVVSQCVINANLNCIYQEKYKLEQQGMLTTDWHQKTFTVERQESLREINQQMASFLNTIYDRDMIALIEQMEQLPGVITAEEMENVITRLRVYGEKAEALGEFYGQMWGAIAREKREDGNDDAVSE